MLMGSIEQMPQDADLPSSYPVLLYPGPKVRTATAILAMRGTENYLCKLKTNL